MHMIGQKNTNSVKTILYYGPKESIRCPFIPFFHEKIHAVISWLFFVKNRPFCEKHITLMPTICQKNVHSRQNTMLSCHFFILKTPCFHAQDQSKKVNSVKPTLYYCQKKWIGFPYFPNFHEKITALKPIFGQKRPFSKKQTAFISTFCQKTSILSRKWCSHVSFFRIFHKNPLLSCLYLVERRQFCENYTILRF